MFFPINPERFLKIPKGKLLMTPDSPFFYEILHGKLPPGWQNNFNDETATFYCVDENGILRHYEFDDYLEYTEDGLFDHVMEELWQSQTS